LLYHVLLFMFCWHSSAHNSLFFNGSVEVPSTMCWQCWQEVSRSPHRVHLSANVSFCLPGPGCRCSRSGAVFAMTRCLSSAGSRAASSSMLEASSAGTRTRKEPWRWPGEPCRPPPRPLQTEAVKGSERMANGTFCCLGQSLERIKIVIFYLTACLSQLYRANAVLFRLDRTAMEMAVQ